jgi:isoquinoline 1-oxidoreductase beta subunit
MNTHVKITNNLVDREPADLSRRSFLVGSAATGLALGYSAVPGLLGADQAFAATGNFDPSVWYSIAPDGIVTVTCGKADMGQHIASTVAQIISEELGASWKDMRVQLASNDPKFNDPVLGVQITGGSWSTMMNFDAMSRAGAAGRIALTEAAAAAMGVPAGELVVRESTITNPKSKKSMTFADIVKSGKATKTFTPDELKAIKLKAPDQYTMIGVSVPQLDIPSKTNGTAKYGIDVMLPGMVYGAVVTPPVRYGATVKSVDDSAAKKVPGFIKAVTLDDKTGTTTGWVVAVANTYTNARKAADALKVSYDGGPNAKLSSQSLFDEARRLQALGDSGLFFVKDGDTAAAFGTAAKVMEAEYTTNINVHGALEPMNATAQQQGDIWHIYSGNQFATRSGAIAAGAAGVDPKFVVMHQMWLGGGFGRRLEGDMMVPAVQAAKAVGKPVKIIYSRENDMTMDFSRPLTFQKIKAGLDGDGKLVAMNHDVVAAWPTKRWGIPDFLSPSVDKKGALDALTVNGADFFYSVPNHNVRAILNEMAQQATPSGQLRSVAPGWTFWAVESMIDELAHAAGKDPAQYRISMLDGAGANAGGAQRSHGLVRLRNQATAEGRRHGRGLRFVAGKGDGQLDRVRGPCCRCAKRRGQGQETDRGHRRRHAGASRQHPRPGRGRGVVGTFARAIRKGDAEGWRYRTDQLRYLHAVADESDTGSRHQRHRQWRTRHRRRRTGGDGDRARARERDLQCLRRPRPFAADHGRGGKGGDEGLNAASRPTTAIRRRVSSGGFFGPGGSPLPLIQILSSAKGRHSQSLLSLGECLVG